jgi:hypothetical protein
MDGLARCSACGYRFWAVAPGEEKSAYMVGPHGRLDLGKARVDEPAPIVCLTCEKPATPDQALKILACGQAAPNISPTNPGVDGRLWKALLQDSHAAASAVQSSSMISARRADPRGAPDSSSAVPERAPASNPMARRRSVDDPYLIFTAPGIEWRVLKAYQRDNGKLGARWLVAVDGPAGEELGNEYVVRVVSRGWLVYQDPSLPEDLLEFEPAPDPMALLLAGALPGQISAARWRADAGRARRPRRQPATDAGITSEQANAYLRALVVGEGIDSDE